MSEIPAKLTPEKCPCGDPHCDKWGFKEGTFYQGNGFSREVAEEIARRYNEYESLQEYLWMYKDLG